MAQVPGTPGFMDINAQERWVPFPHLHHDIIGIYHPFDHNNGCYDPIPGERGPDERGPAKTSLLASLFPFHMDILDSVA